MTYGLLVRNGVGDILLQDSDSTLSRKAGNASGFFTDEGISSWIDGQQESINSVNWYGLKFSDGYDHLHPSNINPEDFVFFVAPRFRLSSTFVPWPWSVTIGSNTNKFTGVSFVADWAANAGATGGPFSDPSWSVFGGLIEPRDNQPPPSGYGFAIYDAAGNCTWDDGFLVSRIEHGGLIKRSEMQSDGLNFELVINVPPEVNGVAIQASCIISNGSAPVRLYGLGARYEKDDLDDPTSASWRFGFYHCDEVAGTNPSIEYLSDVSYLLARFPGAFFDDEEGSL